MSRPLDPSRSNDPYYRYKRPFVTIRHSNDNKTHITNLNEICKGIFRGKKLLLSYIANKLATNVNDKKGWIKGFHFPPALEICIDEFVLTYVLCTSCGNPETDVKIKSSRNLVYLKCKACGSRTILPQTDKLTKKILNTSKSILS
jgi:translation initiation factor 5